MFCENCGTENKEGAAFCNSCGDPLPVNKSYSNVPEIPEIPDTKGNRIIRAKIKTKEVEYENNNGYGPTVLIVIGLITSIWIVGIGLVVIGVIWSWYCSNARSKAIAEIDELETELD